MSIHHILVKSINLYPFNERLPKEIHLGMEKVSNQQLSRLSYTSLIDIARCVKITHDVVRAQSGCANPHSAHTDNHACQRKVGCVHGTVCSTFRRTACIRSTEWDPSTFEQVVLRNTAISHM